MEFPQKLSFLRDTSVSIGLTMFIFFMIISVIATFRPEFSPEMLVDKTGSSSH